MSCSDLYRRQRPDWSNTSSDTVQGLHTARAGDFKTISKMALKSGGAFCLAVSMVCSVVTCRPWDDGVKSVKGAKVWPPAFIDGGSFKGCPLSSSDAGCISSSSGEHGSFTQADSSSMSSSESGSFNSEDPSGSSSNVGGHTESYSGQLGSLPNLDSTETSHGSGDAAADSGSTVDGHGAASEHGAHGHGDSDDDNSGGLAKNVSGQKNIIAGTDGFLLGGAHGGSGDDPEEFQTTDAGALDGSTRGFGTVDSAAAEENSTFPGSSSASGVDSVNGSDFGSHADSGSQPGASGSGSSSSSPHSSSASDVKGTKKLPVGVKG